MTTMKPAMEFFADTRLEVAYAGGRRTSRVFLVDTTAKTWDGAKPETNAAVYSTTNGAMSYVELKLTGRIAKYHPGRVYGLKARVRFTGSDDTGEWIDAVLRPVPASHGAVV